MITVLLVNLVGVVIYVAGVSMCMRTAKRTGNHGYLLMAAYFVAALIVTSLNQVRDFERGPQAPEDLYAAPAMSDDNPTVEPQETEETDEQSDAIPAADDTTDGGKDGGDKSAPSPGKDLDEVPPPSPESQLTVSPPILPALLLAAVWLISRDDPRRGKEVAEEEEAAAPAAESDGSNDEGKEA